MKDPFSVWEKGEKNERRACLHEEPKMILDIITKEFVVELES